jgi:hypothetical protein
MDSSIGEEQAIEAARGAIMKARWVLIWMSMVILGLSGAAVPDAGAEVRSVRGQVVAVNVTDSPQVIVVKAMTPDKKELIVGATVDSGAEITRGNQRITLKDVKVGESAQLTYTKSPDGLAARSIRIR